MEISAYLYDANGTDEEVELTDDICAQLTNEKILWIDVRERTREAIEFFAGCLKLKNIPVASLIKTSERPKLDKYESFYRFSIVSVDARGGADEPARPLPIDFVVGKNFIVTIHDGEIPYFKEFRQLDEGETQLGELDAEGFVTTFLDFHVVSYFKAIEKIEHHVDRFDEQILKTDLKEKDLLEQMVRLRRDASRLRHWFVPQREVFYALSRPDFRPTAESDNAGSFQNLNQHFENAVDAIENSRETVLSLFELYTTRASHRMNNQMKRLTFITFIVGSMSVIAGVLGMNFEENFFKSAGGFWIALAAMGVLAGLLFLFAKFRDWI